MGRLISQPQNPERLFGVDDFYARTHLGNTVKPVGEHVFCLRLPMPQESEHFAIPEEHLAPFGRHQAGAPHQYAVVLAVGPDVKEVKVRDYVVIDPMNSEPQKFGETWYFFPREIAILLHSKEPMQ